MGENGLKWGVLGRSLFIASLWLNSANRFTPAFFGTLSTTRIG
jgi:hypothetical protein